KNCFMSPPQRSTAANPPVEAADGTAARFNDPHVKRTTTSTVGLPRESRISLALVASIKAISANLLGKWVVPLWVLLTYSQAPVYLVWRRDRTNRLVMATTH